MNRTSRLYGATGVAALLACAASPAHAAGTLSGTSIKNDVTVSYSVGGTAQTASTGSDTFVVDRKVMLTVAEFGGSTNTATPNDPKAVTIFRLTNSSNDTLDFDLAATNRANGSSKHAGGVDNYDVSDFAYYRDANADGIAQDGELVTYIDQLAPDQTVTILVAARTPLGRVTGDEATVRLTATALLAGAAGAKGGALTNDKDAANVAGTVQNVFADDNANGNTAGDGAAFDDDDFRVAAAAITAAKSSRILWDPISASTNPKMIPGAVVEYCVAVTNAAGSATATGVSLSDNLPAGTTYLPNGTVASGTGVADNTGIGIMVDGTGTVTGTAPAFVATCTGGGTNSGTYTAGTRNVAGALSDIAAAATRTLRFRVVID